MQGLLATSVMKPCITHCPVGGR